LKNKLRVNIALRFAIALVRHGFVFHEKTGGLQVVVETFVPLNVTDKDVGAGHIVVVLKVVSEFMPIERPSRSHHSSMNVLRIDESVVACHGTNITRLEGENVPGVFFRLASV
jgi:hypothetical protein